VNALPTLCFDRARAHARVDEKRPGTAACWRACRPIKDLTNVAVC
jgi:hypothetical protein